MVLTPQHPHAITFCVLEGGAAPVVLISRDRPHLHVYHGLKKCEPEASRTKWKEALEDYQTQVVRGRLSRAGLENFHRLTQASNGFPRYELPSGRLWRHLKVAGQPMFSVMTFWNHGMDEPAGPAVWVSQALKVKGPIYLVSSEKTGGAWHTLEQK